MGDQEKGTEEMNVIKKATKAVVRVWDSMPPWAQFWVALFLVLLPLGVFIGLGIAFGWVIWGTLCMIYIAAVTLVVTLLSTGDFDRA